MVYVDIYKDDGEITSGVLSARAVLYAVDVHDAALPENTTLGGRNYCRVHLLGGTSILVANRNAHWVMFDVDRELNAVDTQSS